jgi:dienelactone hydrolase
VGRITISFTSTSSGCSIANAIARAIASGGVDWQMNLYGGVVHSFTNPAADGRGMPQMARYDAKADARSWAEMRAFFDEIFGSSQA